MNDALRVAICEDTPEDASKLLSIMEQIKLPTTCAIFPSAESFLEVYSPGGFDLLLSDIYMTGMSGVDLVTRIRETDEELPVAFVTTSPDHTLESYRLSVLKYIEKPYRKRDIESILHLARMERDSLPALSIRQNGKEDKVRLSQIVFLEQQSHRLNIHLSGGTVYQISDKLSQYLDELEENDFFQPHKSFAVNLSFVRSIDTDLRCFVMQGGKNVPIRRESMSKARQALQDHLFRQTRSIAN